MVQRWRVKGFGVEGFGGFRSLSLKKEGTPPCSQRGLLGLTTRSYVRALEK